MGREKEKREWREDEGRGEEREVEREGERGVRGVYRDGRKGG